MAGFLSNRSMLRAMADGINFVSTYDKGCLQPASIDLRFSGDILAYRHDSHLIGKPPRDEDLERRSAEELEIQPNSGVILALAEIVSIPAQLIGLLFPRNSLSKLGFLINPVYFNPGYSGQPTVLCFNASASTLKLVKGTRIAQLVLANLDAQPDFDYSEQEGAKYVDEEAAHSKIHDDIEIKKLIAQIAKERAPSLVD